MMIHFQLNRAIQSNTLNFRVSQEFVYGTPGDFPMFVGPNGTDIDLLFVAHTLNFFQHHLTSPQEPASRAFKDLGNDKPKPWRKPLVDGAQFLGKRWAGVYAFLEHDELAELREGGQELGYFMDSFQGESEGNEIQVMPSPLVGRVVRCISVSDTNMRITDRRIRLSQHTGTLARSVRTPPPIQESPLRTRASPSNTTTDTHKSSTPRCLRQHAGQFARQ